mgnify:CR=1 FL=1
MAAAVSIPIFLLFANEQGGTITLDFVLAEDAERSDGSKVSAGQPFAASFTHVPGVPPWQTMRTLERWAARSRAVHAVSGIDSQSRHLLVLSQDDSEVVLEYW